MKALVIFNESDSFRIRPPSELVYSTKNWTIFEIPSRRPGQIVRHLAADSRRENNLYNIHNTMGVGSDVTPRRNNVLNVLLASDDED